MKTNLRQNKAITLIALVITIIIILILAGVTIASLTGDNGLLKRAVEAKESTEKAQIVEQARLDILAKIAEKKGQDPKEDEIKAILGTYFNDVPASLEDLTKKMTTKSGGYTVELSEVLNGIAIAKDEENNKTPISKSTGYVGYYADIDNDGDVDGIIYADMIVGNTKSGRWNYDDYGWSDYNVTKIDDVTSVKDYVVSSKIYEGQTTAGIYKANDGFGGKEVLVPATNGAGTKDRFYVMTLEDFTNNSKNQFYWYYNASGKLDRPIQSATADNDFGNGKENTIKMLDDWNNKTSTYGAQTTVSSGKDFIDLWGAIQDDQYSIVSSATDSGKWFIPSKGEWSAFGEELGITPSNYINKGFSDWYWSSSQYNEGEVCDAVFDEGFLTFITVGSYGCVRLSTTF